MFWSFILDNENYTSNHESYNGIFEGESYAGNPNARSGLAKLWSKLQEKKLAELREMIANDTSAWITASNFKVCLFEIGFILFFF